jgi:hypothetical protein
MNKHYYVYLITNKINGKQYIGDHSTSNEDDNYLGSGIYLKKALKKYGKNNFKKEVLQYFDSKKDAFDAQEKYINQFNTLIPNGYNISPKGGHGVSGCFSEETIKKFKNLKHTEKTKQIIRKAHLGKSQSEEHIKKRTKAARENRTYVKGELNPLYGRKRPKDVVEKINKKNRGKKHTPLQNSEKSKRQLGSKRSDTAKENLSKGQQKRQKIKKLCPYCNREVGFLNYGRWHGKNCKNYISSSSAISSFITVDSVDALV